MNTIDFTERLIKGRIAETIFEMMFGDLKGYKLAHFGVEYTSPELLDQQVRRKNQALIDKIGHTPDFVEVDSQNRVTLVEVKYRKSISHESICKITLGIYEHWPEAALFLITPQGFFFDPVESIIHNNGRIDPLSKDLVTPETQKEYLRLLGRFGLGSKEYENHN